MKPLLKIGRRVLRDVGAGRGPFRLGIVFLTLLLLRCSGPDPAYPEPRLILLYAPCTVNAQFLSPYNATVPYTPNLTEFEKTSLVFARHQTEAGQSGTAYAALFTGTHAMDHGVYLHPTEISDELLTISEFFQQHGYEVSTWLGHDLAGAELNYAQGVKETNLHGTSWHTGLVAGDDAFQQVLAKLQDDRDHRAVIMTTFSTTHDFGADHLDEFCARYPQECEFRGDDFDHYSEMFRQNHYQLSWDFPNTIRELGLQAEQVTRLETVVELLYKANVMWLDELFGDILDQVKQHGLMDESLIVFTADHGQSFYRENAPFQWTHGMQLAPDVSNVPLIVRGPSNYIGPGRYEAVTRSIDLFPTLAALAGLELERDQVTGVNLARAWRGEETPPQLLAFSHSTLPGPPEFNEGLETIMQLFPVNDPTVEWVSVRDNDWVYKLVSPDGARFEPRAYDLAVDPEENVNLFDAKDPIHRRMLEQLQNYKSELVAAYFERHQRELTAAERDKLDELRALGYVGN